jgi:hypothetical protein
MQNEVVSEVNVLDFEAPSESSNREGNDVAEDELNELDPKQAAESNAASNRVSSSHIQGQTITAIPFISSKDIVTLTNAEQNEAVSEVNVLDFEAPSETVSSNMEVEKYNE